MISTPCLDLTQTWNAGGVTFTGIKANVTDTASAATSLLLDLQIGGATQFHIYKSGTLESKGDIRALSNTGQFQLGATGDVILVRDAANTLALRNGVNAQTFRAYNTFTDSSNGEWANIGFSGNTFFIGPNANGTGSQREMQLVTQTGAAIYLATANTNRWKVDSSGNFVAFADNTYDIGASGANRPRNVFAAGNVISGNNIQVATTGSFNWPSRSALTSAADGNIMASNAALTSFGLLQFGGTTSSFPAWKRNAAALESRLADDSARASLLVGDVTSNGYIQRGSTTVSGLKTCTGNSGAMLMVTDATVVASGNFGAAVVGGGANTVPVYCDGTSWKIGRANLFPANDNLPPAYREQADRLWSAFG